MAIHRPLIGCKPSCRHIAGVPVGGDANRGRYRGWRPRQPPMCRDNLVCTPIISAQIKRNKKFKRFNLREKKKVEIETLPGGTLASPGNFFYTVIQRYLIFEGNLIVLPETMKAPQPL